MVVMDLRWIALVLVFGLVNGAAGASEGDVDPLYGTCVEKCEKTGSVGSNFIQNCQLSSNRLANSTWYIQEPLYLRWKEWNCRSDCQYHCMMQREKERQTLGLKPVKYHGKWPFKRISVFQEPVSAILSALTLIVQFNGWLSFFLLVYYKLPLRPESGCPYYEFTGLWHIYGILSMNAWFWSAIFHTRNFDLTEKLDCLSSVALIGFSLILSILRTFNIKTEATRVMVSAPLLAFLTTHILYLNFYELDHGLNWTVSFVMGLSQLIFWGIWVVITRHPSYLKLLTFVIGSALSMLLDLYDSPPSEGYIDCHGWWHATAIPLSYLLWSFVKDDAEFRTKTILNKTVDKTR